MSSSSNSAKSLDLSKYGGSIRLKELQEAHLSQEPADQNFEEIELV